MKTALGQVQVAWVDTSPDGIHWTLVGRAGPSGDRSTFFYNPFRKRWVFSLRGNVEGVDRARLYYEHPDWMTAWQWRPSDPVLWCAAVMTLPPWLVGSFKRITSFMVFSFPQ